MTTDLVLFDIDGTLIRTGGAGVRAFARVADLLFGIRDGTQGIHFHGRTDGSIVSEFLGKHGLPDTPEQRRRFLDAYVFLLEDQLGRHRGEICPGVVELLQELRAQQKPPLVGLLTGNIRLGAALKLDVHGLAEAFETGAFGDDHTDRNELARIALARGSEVLGRPLDGDSVVVIGDTRADIECARAIGARCVAVATGGETLAGLLEHSPALALESLSGVPASQVLSAGRHLERPVDWEGLYQAGDTRWDRGAASPALVDFLESWSADLPRSGTVAVPGCGRGHDARAWARAGFRVQAMDLSPTALREAMDLTPADLRIEYRAADFLESEPLDAVDWLFEHTLFCAIPPQRREQYVRSAEKWVKPGGHFLSVNYLQPRDEAGPPYGVTIRELEQRFGDGFRLLRHWLPASFESRTGRERVLLWQRRF